MFFYLLIFIFNWHGLCIGSFARKTQLKGENWTMKFKKFTIYVVIFSFLFQNFAFGQAAKPQEEKEEGVKENDFFISRQIWGLGKANFLEIQGEFIKARVGETEVFYAVENLGDDGVRISAPSPLTTNNDPSVLFHTISLPTKNLTLSKNYLWIVPRKEENPGFYLVRLADLYHYSFQSPIPVFYMPLAPTIGAVKDISVETSEEGEESQESRVTISTEAGEPISITFEEIEHVVKVQLIYLALQQAIRNPELQELNTLVSSLQSNFNSFYEDLNAELKTAGGENAANFVTPKLRDLNWESATPEELANALSETDSNPQLQAIKEKYAHRLTEIMENFQTAYDGLMSKVEFSFADLNKPVLASEDNPLSELASSTSSDTPPLKDKSEERRHQTNVAIGWYGAIAAGTVLALWGLPRTPWRPIYSGLDRVVRTLTFERWGIGYVPPLTGESLSEIGANYSKLHWYRIARPLQNFVRRRAGQEAMYAVRDVTAKQFKRAFYQSLADTATVVGFELYFRPHFRHVGEKGWTNAIMVDAPFTPVHALWWHKNFLYNVLSNQIVGTMQTAASFTVLEKELDDVVKKFIVGQDLEGIINTQMKRASDTVPFKFTEKEQRVLSEIVNSDINDLKEKMTERLKERAERGLTTKPGLFEVIPEAEITALQESWVQQIEKRIEKRYQTPLWKRIFVRDRPKSRTSFQLIGEVKEAMGRNLKTAIAADTQTALDDAFVDLAKTMTQKKGMFKKMVLALGQATYGGMEKVLGGNAAKEISNWGTKSVKYWCNQFEPQFWNMFLLHTPFRGSFNPSIFIFHRGLSLVFLTPFYVGSYTLAKRTIGVRTSLGEFAYGTFYGIVTSYVFSYLFLQLYEKPLLGTKYDLEFVKYWNHFLGDGRPLIDEQLRFIPDNEIQGLTDYELQYMSNRIAKTDMNELDSEKAQEFQDLRRRIELEKTRRNSPPTKD